MNCEWIVRAVATFGGLSSIPSIFSYLPHTLLGLNHHFHFYSSLVVACHGCNTSQEPNQQYEQTTVTTINPEDVYRYVWVHFQMNVVKSRTLGQRYLMAMEDPINTINATSTLSIIPRRRDNFLKSLVYFRPLFSSSQFDVCCMQRCSDETILIFVSLFFFYYCYKQKSLLSECETDGEIGEGGEVVNGARACHARKWAALF